ncbi:MAG: pterin-4-alpha-carbinolamine dehydratase, partial [Hydrogenophaga sp. SCN 70-13]
MHPIHQNRRALNATEIVTQLSQLNGSEADGWKLIDGAIERTFRFANYHETMAFVNAMAWIAHREDHHPDAAFGYNRCTLRF